MDKLKTASIGHYTKNIFSLAAPILLVIGGLMIVWSFRKEVTVITEDNVNAYTVYSSMEIGDFLEANDFQVGPDTRITPSEGQIINGLTITIDHPEIYLIDNDDIKKEIKTHQVMPANIISVADIELFPRDQILLDGEIVPQDQEIQPSRKTRMLEIRRATPLTVSFENESIDFYTHEKELGDALEQYGLEISPDAIISPTLDTELSGTIVRVTIDLPKSVEIEYYGQEFSYQVFGNTVSEALEEVGFTLQGLDYTIPAENSIITDTMKIRVVHVEQELVIEEIPLEFSVEYQPVSDMEIDTIQQIQNGEYGIQTDSSIIRYENGNEVERLDLESRIIKNPQPTIIGYGTQTSIKEASTPDGVLQYWRAVTVYATSYSPCRLGVEDYCSSTTASGATLRKGVIGVTRNWYNYMQGQQVYIPGYGYATIEDIGAGFPDRLWIDLGYSDENWVRWSQYVTLYFLPPVPSNILYILN